MKRVVGVFLAVILSAVPLMMVLGSGKAWAVPSQGWSKTYGGTGIDTAFALVQTGDGGYALAGKTTSFGATYGDFWLVKADGDGNHLWNKTYGGASYDGAYALVNTSDGGYALAGYTAFGAGYADFSLVKTDADGNMQWNMTYGVTDSADFAHALVQTGDGGYAIAGEKVYPASGSSVAWLVKTYANGSMQWNMTYEGIDFTSALALVQTGHSGYAIAGVSDSHGVEKTDFCLVETDSSGNVQWNRTYDNDRLYDSARALVQTSEGGYALAGPTQTWGGGESYSWLVKTDENGNHLWNKTYSEFWNQAYALVQTGTSGYALAGYKTDGGMGGHRAAWLLKTDTDGNVQWNRTYGEVNAECAEALVQTADGGYALAGSTSSDFCLVKTDENGVIPEFPSNMVLAAFMVTVVFAAVLVKRKQRVRLTRTS